MNQLPTQPIFGPDDRYLIETWGCQMNVHDSEKLAGSLRQLGLQPASTEDDATIFILNTCSIREKAQEKVFSRLQWLTSSKRPRRRMIVGVTGCVAQQEGEAILKRAPAVDFVLGTQSLVQLPEVLASVVAGGEKVVSIGRHPENLDIPPERIERVAGVKAYVTIIEGCDNFCTFCIVPYTRGRERCRPAEDIVREVDALGRAGYREVQLLGQNVNSYRNPGVAGGGFEELLDAVNGVSNVSRLRFTSPHPKDFGAPLIARFRDLDKLCPHMHLPAQSGSSAVLERMNRGYTRETFLGKVAEARRAVPDLAFTTDLIVGFPGETDRDFEDTLDLLREVRFDGVYSFKYSERPFTHAAKALPDDVPDAVKSARLAALQELQQGLQREKNEGLVGDRVEVLVEGSSRMDPDEKSGRSPHHRVVNFAGVASVGDLAPVRITRAGPNSLYGRLDH